jgi:hypothetical protein
MGYLVIGVLILLLLGLLIAALARGKPPSGTIPHKKPIGFEKPAAEEPTPGASSTASSRQADNASKRTPPA